MVALVLVVPVLDSLTGWLVLLLASTTTSRNQLMLVIVVVLAGASRSRSRLLEASTRAAGGVTTGS